MHSVAGRGDGPPGLRPTAVIQTRGLRLLTNPTLARPRRITAGTPILTETRPLGAEEIGPVDVVLPSHGRSGEDLNEVVTASARRGWSDRPCLLAPSDAATL